jgi:hypothetical protein
MGFNLSSFAGGFAEAAVEDIQKERKLAELRGTEAVKNLYTNYKTVVEDNKKKEAELVNNINILKTYDPTATESELYAVATSAPVMTSITDYIKKDGFDAQSFKLGNFAKVVNDNSSTATALERVKMLSVLPTAARDTITKQLEPSSGNIIRDMLSKSSSSAKEKAMIEQAQALGVPLERLKAAQGFVRPVDTVNATYDMSKLRPPKTFAQQEDEAKAKILLATKNNDPTATRLAQADLAIVNSIKDSMSSEQVKFSERIVTLKNASLNGTPEEKKRADTELLRIWELERREAEAKKVRGDDGEGKVPNLSTLNTFTGAAVGRALAAKYGDLLKSKQLAIIENADGSTRFSYVGTDATTRKAILDLQASAAQTALSLYTDSKGMPINRDVASVLNSFKAPAQMQEAAPTTPAPAAPALPPSSSGGRPAAAPQVNIQEERRKANAAISGGADSAAVKARFKQATGQDL